MALLGAILGDIIGSRIEYSSWKSDEFNYKTTPLLVRGENEFTDDTVLSLAVKNALINNISFEQSYMIFANLYPNKGYGDMFRDWVENNRSIKSYGNGSAMRVSYLGEISDDYSKIKDLVLQSVIPTHNTEEGIRGAETVVECIIEARKTKDKTRIASIIKRNYKGLLYDGTQSLQALRQNYYWSDRCDLTVPVAIQCFLESENYESCMRNCFSLDCDTDTFCCISGGIAEEYYGETLNNYEEIIKYYLPKELRKILFI